MTDIKRHWETIYASKQPHEVSWTQDIPQTSLDFIQQLSLPKTANIIDIGGGDSRFVDFLLDLGYKNITVLDISVSALNRAIERLGEKAKTVNWIESDILDFKPKQKYDFWHDRATFHFFLDREDIESYINIVSSAVSGYLLLSTFSNKGPEKCSGLDVNRYDEDLLQHLLAEGFDKIKCITEDHITPFNTKQNFLFCCFVRKQKQKSETR